MRKRKEQGSARSIRDILSTDDVAAQLARTKARTERAAKPSKEAAATTNINNCSNWSLDGWAGWLKQMAYEFDVPYTLRDENNDHKVRAVMKSFVESGIESFGCAAALLEATLNLLVSWEDEDLSFFASQPEQFHLGYISRAWDSYKSHVAKDPSLRLACYEVSDNLSSRLTDWINETSTIDWLGDYAATKSRKAAPFANVASLHQQRRGGSDSRGTKLT